MPDFSLAMAYVPWQPFQNVYEDAEAHDIGTIFADLNLDFYGRRCN
ncbi:MAG: spore coat associated protein CotJA [Lachnospiraceae bacterium]|nr:spore coat associated protein CotJA [Lachnospiraceae bacterium]